LDSKKAGRMRLRPNFGPVPPFDTTYRSRLGRSLALPFMPQRCSVVILNAVKDLQRLDPDASLRSA
jgi:hypothetical protein